MEISMIQSLQRPIGLGKGIGTSSDVLSVGVREPKLWIATAIGAGVGVLSSILGGSKAAKAEREAMKIQKRREAAHNAWYNRRYNEDYVDTAAGQNLLRRAKQFYNETARRAKGAEKVGGATNAATAMAKEAANKAYGDTVANISAQDTARKMRVDDMNEQAQERYAQINANREIGRAGYINNAAQNAANAAFTVGAAVDQATPNTTSLTGGSNHSYNPDLPEL
jgi:hypothetical protein